MTGLVNWDQLWKTTLLSNNRIGLFDKNFWENNTTNHKADGPLANLTDTQLSRIQTLPEYTALDIGAGTGRLAIPLAKRVKQVTAVEPSVNRVKLLEENIEAEKINNIVIVKRPWEELTANDIAPHDVVFASFSFFMANLEGALKKVDALTKKAAYIFLSATKPCEDEIQKIITGNVSVLQMADYLYVYNTLHDLGIYADVEVWSYVSEESYGSLDEALAKISQGRIFNSDVESALREFLQRRLAADGEGKLGLKRRRRAAVIRWSKEQVF